MRFENLEKEEIRNCFNNLNDYLNLKDRKYVKYIDLKCAVIRLISYSAEFIPLSEKQLTYVLKDDMPYYDATLVVWKEEDMENLAKKICDKFNPRTNMRLRIESLIFKENDIFDIAVKDDDFSFNKPVIDIQNTRGFFIGNDYQTNTYYYGVRNLEPEEFIKEGHIFVQFFNNILKTKTTNLVHGAVVGFDDNGILFCARGQRGKSTLAVLSMIKGFDYVSDDYLILSKENNELYSYPIYSIITLSPRMYNELYDYLSSSRFVSNNARKDKYVFNISNFHDKFKVKYPIKLCIFPEITSNKNPSIYPCKKGRAIAQLIHSTLMQTADLSDTKTVKKLIDMVYDFEFYKFDLCCDIEKNTQFLKEFLEEFKNKKEKIVLNDFERFYIDITFDLANIIDSATGAIYSMNKFATCVYENLVAGVKKEKIIQELQYIPNIEKNINYLIDSLTHRGILADIVETDKNPSINKSFIEESQYVLSIHQHYNSECIELVKENKENRNELCIK